MMALLSKIAKPEKFNSTELAIVFYDNFRNVTTVVGRPMPPLWADLSHEVKMLWVDAAQYALDDFKLRGIIE